MQLHMEYEAQGRKTGPVKPHMKVNMYPWCLQTVYHSIQWVCCMTGAFLFCMVNEGLTRETVFTLVTRGHCFDVSVKI